jgi:hypothetical protein
MLYNVLLTQPAFLEYGAKYLTPTVLETQDLGPYMIPSKSGPTVWLWCTGYRVAWLWVATRLSMRNTRQGGHEIALQLNLTPHASARVAISMTTPNYPSTIKPIYCLNTEPAPPSLLLQLVPAVLYPRRVSSRIRFPSLARHVRSRDLFRGRVCSIACS